jgi:pimeloyl-ACP methyl ester carboxylesterase
MDKSRTDVQKTKKVVGVHCSTSSPKQWRSLESLLGPKYAPIAIELYGHGQRAPWRGEGPLTLAAEAEAIEEVSADAGETIHLIGHSYGGGVALQFALTHPDRLCSLTLIEPSCFHLLGERSEYAGLFAQVKSVADRVSAGVISGDYFQAMEVFIEYWNGPGSWHALPEHKRFCFASKAANVAQHFAGLFGARAPLSRYAELKMPTLIICGECSPLPSCAITQMLASTMPNARRETVAGANHMSPITHSEIVDMMIVNHLDEVLRWQVDASAANLLSTIGDASPRAGETSRH